MKIITLLLSFILVTNVCAKPQQVSHEEIQSLIHSGKAYQVKRILLAQNETEEEEKKKKEDEERSYEYGPFDVLADMTLDLSDGRGLLVFFAVVGIVVTVVWIASVPYSAYVAAKNRDKYQFLDLLTIGHSFVTSDTLNGHQDYLKYHFVFKKGEEALHSGLVAETGYYDFEHLHGLYWLLGPSAALRTEKFIYKLDLLGGSAFHREIGLIAKAELGIMFEFTRRFYFGLNYALQYQDIKDTRGITTAGKPDYLAGATFSYRF